MPVSSDHAASPSDPFAPLTALDASMYEGLAAADRARVERLYAAVRTAVESRDARLVARLEDWLDAYEPLRVPGVLAVASAMRACADAVEPGTPLATMCGRGCLLAGQHYGRAKASEPARDWYGRALALLDHRGTTRARELWAYAAQQLVRLDAETDPDATLATLTTLVAEAGARFAPYPRNRALEATTVWLDAQAEHQPAAVVERVCAAALGLSREAPNKFTYEFVVSILATLAARRRHAGDLEGALACCTEAAGLAPHVSTNVGVEQLVWALTEGAFLAADKLARPDAALAFVRAAREATRERDDEWMRTERAYAIAMEARCCLQLGQRERALACCDEASALAEALQHVSGGRGALASTMCTRGELLAQSGQINEAEGLWRAVVARFEHDESADVRLEAVKARALLGRAAPAGQ